MPFGSHGGDDHYVITNEAEVERLLIRDVPEADRSAFRAELTAAAPSEGSPALRARVHLAMLYLADGDLGRLRSARELADTDWRDVLMQAEYPSTPPFGTNEASRDRASRQSGDVNATDEWRNRS